MVARHPDRFRVAALAANTDWEKLAALCRTHRPAYAAMQDVAAARALAHALAADGVATRVLDGPAGLAFVAALPEVDTVLAAIVGAAGLAPTLAAARAGKRILLANKEALVIGGQLFMRAVRGGRRRAASDRQRTQRDLPVPAGGRMTARRAAPACVACCSRHRAGRFARARSPTCRR